MESNLSFCEYELLSRLQVEKIKKQKKITTDFHVLNFSEYIDTFKEKKGSINLSGEDFNLKEIQESNLWIAEDLRQNKTNWEDVKKLFLNSLSWEKLQVGEPLEIEETIEDLFEKMSRQEVMENVYKIVLDNYDNSMLICSLLHALSHFEYEKIYPQGAMLAMATLGHTDKNVVSYSMKAFSNWNSKDSLKYVTYTSPKQAWAEREWKRIQRYIKENGDELNGIFNAENKFTQMAAGVESY